MDEPPITKSKSVTLIDPAEENGRNRSRGNIDGHLYSKKSSKASLRSKELYDEELSDEEPQQTTPMMPRAVVKDGNVGHRQAATPAPSYLTGEKQSYLDFDTGDLAGNMDSGVEPPRPVAPTGTLAWVGFGLSVLALACMCISFASPYWLQQWELSFNTFNNMGLWEACFHNYMHHRDDLQEIYNGCFWVYNSEERYNKLRDWLVPPWLISCQVMSTIILLVLIAVVIISALVFLHMCPMMNHEYHQIFAMFIAGAMLFLCTMTSLITAILFGVQIQDRNWMPRPDWNMLSWGYGFLIICGIFSTAAGFCLFAAAWRAYNDLLRNQDNYFKAAMEMAAGFQPSVSQASYGPGDGYGEKPGYSAQPSYATQPSYQEKDSYDRNQGYPSQSSYGAEKGAQYQQQQSHDSQYGRQPMDNPPSYNGKGSGAQQQPQYGHQQSYDDGDRSYDSRDRSYDDRGGYNQQGYSDGQYGQQRA